METQEKKSKLGFFKRNLDIFILCVVVAVALLFSGLQVFQLLDYRFYDSLLALTRDVKQDGSNIVLIDIDDDSLNEIGSWPWTRDIIGNVLLRMKELGAGTAVFDIEYLSPSTIAVQENIGEIAQEEFGSGIEKIEKSISGFAADIAARRISAANAGGASQSLLSNDIEPVLYDMYQRISEGLNKDNDLFFGQALQFFGNSSLTVNIRDIGVPVSEEDAAYAEARFLFTNVVDSDNMIARANSATLLGEEKAAFVPALNKIISFAQGAGFTNVVIDADGSRRRVELLNHRNGKYTGQLAFAPLARLLDVQFMERRRNALVLNGAKIPGKEGRRNIRIPLDMKGNMIINWLHVPYTESFKHSPVSNFHYLDLDEKQVLADLGALYHADVSAQDDWLAETFDTEIRGYVGGLLGQYEETKKTLAQLLARCRGFDIEGNAIGGGLTDDDYAAYFGARTAFFEEAAGLAEELVKGFGTDAIPEIGNLAESIGYYMEDFGAMQEVLKDSFCIIGNSATGSTDLGTTPFERRYANMGTHANVVNTILQEDFITEVNPIYAVVIVFVLIFGNLLVSRKFSSAFKNIHGLLYLLVPPTITAVLFVALKIYIPLSAPLFVCVVTYLAELAYNFYIENAEKNTLRRGFDAYVAPEVVSQIVKNPGLLGLGGMNKHMTALFSDVQKFSAFTEQINKAEGESHGAVRLVEILNGYLGVLSDAIMECRGTIDKYVGDEIVSFFGAPVDNPNNAFDSCVAGIRMKQAEDRYNEEHLEELPLHPVHGGPFLLKSRVGCNTGDMVVGNMGTEKKLNYTIMGNNVNLASRLEGTNKEYDSWIMVAESTWSEANAGENEGKLVARQLDCVKVINVEKPVQIYSIVGLRNELFPEEIEAAEIFNKGMEWYLKGRENPSAPKDLGDFKQAIEHFQRAYKCLAPMRERVKEFISPEQKMAARCQSYLKNGLPRDKDGKILPWDGVFTMATK